LDDLTGKDDDDDKKTSLGLPEGKTLVFIDASSPKHYALNTTTEALTDLNTLAASSADSSIQKLAINDTSTIGYFFHWPDFREVGDDDQLDDKYLLMKPNEDLATDIDSTKVMQLVHFHGDDLAAHSADEFESPEPGSAKEVGLARLNAYRVKYNALFDEVEEALGADTTAEGQTLCKAFIDPYQAYEDGDHYHGMHFGLTTSGRVYFYQPNESDEMEIAQGFVTLTGVSSIQNCDRVTITRTGDDGVLVFIPDTQRLYLVDSHGGDYHLHSTWLIADILPAGVTADLMAALGEGDEDHDHDDHDEEEHDH
jgi:hypothetical protein